MKKTADLHVHTVFCDGKNTLEEMVQAAIEKGLGCIGFSGHGYTFYDDCYCMSPEGTLKYAEEIERLKKKYEGRIRILLGTEQDLWSGEAELSIPGRFSVAGASPKASGPDRVAPEIPYDYKIASVHYLRIPAAGISPEFTEGTAALSCSDVNTEENKAGFIGSPSGESYIYIPVDESPEIINEASRKYFGGDNVALAECYFNAEALVAEYFFTPGKDPDVPIIIGHFDLVSKFCERGFSLDTESPRYIRAWQKAADRLLETGALFEINTGAISRGYRTWPYPAKDIIEYIRERGGRFILSSDSHRRETLCFGFEEYEDLAISPEEAGIL